MKNNLIAIGKIVSFHGLKGELKVLPYTDFPERIFDLQSVKIDEDGSLSVRNIEYARFHGRHWLIKFEGINSREDASYLKGHDIYIGSSERHELPPDHYYHDDLIGLKVILREGPLLGYIKEIIPAGGQDLLSVESGERNKPLLIPAAKEIVIDVSLKEGCITVNLPEGLLDL